MRRAISGALYLALLANSIGGVPLAQPSGYIPQDGQEETAPEQDLESKLKEVKRNTKQNFDYKDSFKYGAGDVAFVEEATSTEVYVKETKIDGMLVDFEYSSFLNRRGKESDWMLRVVAHPRDNKAGYEIIYFGNAGSALLSDVIRSMQVDDYESGKLESINRRNPARYTTVDKYEYLLGVSPPSELGKDSYLKYLDRWISSKSLETPGRKIVNPPSV